MKSIAVILAMVFCMNSNAQGVYGIQSEVGLNRIGILYGLGFNAQFNAHSFNLGARLYEPDLVFEQNYPGLNLGYNYSFRRDKKMKFLIGGSFGVFYEKKLNTSLWLFDPKMIVGPSWKLSNHFKLQLTAGIGTAVSAVNSKFYDNKDTFTYLNYELALGLTYHFWTNFDD